MFDLRRDFLENRGMEYKLTRSKRRTVALEIKNGKLVVKAPYLAPKFAIERFISEKQSWIKKHLEKSKTDHKETRQYKTGEKYLYLGEKKNLEIGDAGEVKISDDLIKVSAKNEIEVKIKLRKFYKVETARIVKKYLAKYLDKFSNSSPKITYKFYKSKWGSCSVKNHFSFSALLAMAPQEVIEYVVIHELAHAKVKNHSKKFWYEVEKFDLNYKIHRKWLRDNHHKLSL